MSTTTCHGEKQTLRKLLLVNQDVFGVEIGNEFWTVTREITVIDSEVDRVELMRAIRSNRNIRNPQQRSGKIMLAGRCAAKWIDCDGGEEPGITFLVTNSKGRLVSVDECDLDRIQIVN